MGLCDQKNQSKTATDQTTRSQSILSKSISEKLQAWTNGKRDAQPQGKGQGSWAGNEPLISAHPKVLDFGSHVPCNISPVSLSIRLLTIPLLFVDWQIQLWNSFWKKGAS